MPQAPLFLILPGVTADAERFSACRELAQAAWPEAEVEMPDYLAHWRGVRGVGRWLDAWARRLPDPGRKIHVLAYILGGAALPFAPGLAARIERAVILRSPHQEQVPVALRRRLGPLGGLLFGKSVWDLGGMPFWPAGYRPAFEFKVLVEGRPSRIAQRLRIQAPSLEALGLEAAESLPLDHDLAYHSKRLLRASVDYLRTDQGTKK